MNVRIFWVRAMKCMCAQTRPHFVLSSERVLGGMEFEPMLTPREKSPLPENFPRGGSDPRRCGQQAQTLPTSYSGPPHQRVESACYCFCQVLKTDKDKEEAKHEEEMAELMEKHAKELQDLGMYKYCNITKHYKMWGVSVCQHEYVLLSESVNSKYP